MTLARLLRWNHPAAPRFDHPVPDLRLEYEGRPVTPAEIEALLGNLRDWAYLEEPLPEAWREPVGLALLELFDGMQNRRLLCNAAIGAGPLTLARLAGLVEQHPAAWVPVEIVRPLFARDGLAAFDRLLEIMAQFGRTELNKALVIDELMTLGKEGLIRPQVNDLIFKPSPARQWPALQAAGFQFTGAEFKVCAKLPEHADFLDTLVFEVSEPDAAPRYERLPFLLTDEARVSVAHPAAMPAAEVARWRAAPGKGPARFDQWAFDAQSIDWKRLRISPTRLLMRLEKQGWLRGAPDPAGFIRWHARAFPDLGVRAVIEYDGVPVRPGADWAMQSIRDVRYEGPAHPLAVAVVMRDLAELSK